MMCRLGFHLDWVTLVMRCVCSASYTIGVNEGVSNAFHPFKGLRQGDPLSPYLFLICVEGFSALLNHAKSTGLIRGALSRREGLSINHLFIADDCVIFGDVTVVSATNVQYIIKQYERALGQVVNFDKSLVYFGANVLQCD